MFNRKRVLMLTLLLVGLVVQGFCGGGSASSGGADNKPVTLKFFSNEQPLRDIYDRVNSEYSRRNPNVNIEMVYIPEADYGMKVDTTILSGEQVDIVYFNNKTAYASRAMQGEFAEMDSLMADEGIRLMDVYTIDASVDDGKVYGLPGDVKYMVVWINKDDLDRVGLPVPPMDWTWDDFREYARKLTWGEGPNKHYGSYMQNWDHFNRLEIDNVLDDNPYLNRDGTHNLNHPGFRSSLEIRHILEQVDKTQLPIAEIVAMQLDYRAVFFGGRASMIFMNSNIIPQTANIDSFPHNFVTTFAPVPRARVNGRLGVTYGSNRYYSIGATTANAAESYKYIRYFSTEGVPEFNVGFSAERKPTVSMDAMVDRMVSKAPHLFDVPALKRIATWDLLRPNIWTYVPSYQSEIGNLYWAEGDKAIMGEISIDQVFANIIPQVEAIIARNK